MLAKKDERKLAVTKNCASNSKHVLAPAIEFFFWQGFGKDKWKDYEILRNKAGRPTTYSHVFKYLRLLMKFEKLIFGKIKWSEISGSN